MKNQPQTVGHTPGPWFTCEQVTRPPQHALVGIGNGATHVGYVSVTPANAFEADANARLIAAAPELLEAMKALFEHCAMTHKYWGDGCNRRQADAAESAARAAIAKATGGSK